MRTRFVARAGETEIGDLDQLIAIEAATRAGDGMGGGPVSGWSPVGELWASVLPLNASEAERLGKARTLTLYRLRVMTEAVAELGVSTTHRARWEGRVMNIREVRTPPASSIFTDLIAEVIG